MSTLVDFPVKPEARPYLDAFKRDDGEPSWLIESRRHGLARFAELGFPSRKSESWRYLDLTPLAEKPLLPAVSRSPQQLAWAREHMHGLLLPGHGPRIVLVDGFAAPELCALDLPEGVWFGPTTQAVRERSHLVKAAVEVIGEDAARPFVGLNTALHSDGFVLDIEPGVILEEPIEIVHLASGSDHSFHTRGVVMLGVGSRASILEVYAGEGRYWRNDVLGVLLGERADLSHNVIVEESPRAVHLAQTEARVGDGARFAGFVLLLSGQRARHEANIRLGDAARCRFDGAFVVSGQDEANIVTIVDHRAPGGQTRELVKGVAAGRGHGAFQGTVIVREGAQKTDAHQLSRNLLIGSRAAIDTKPQLEIYADDVKCSHGASIGDLDEAALFYLQARGIPTEEARHMLIDGFLREVVETVEDFTTRVHLLRRLAGRLGNLEE
jgi:Fe-S cluster assembly protein SufD